MSRAAPAAARSRELAEVLATRRDLRSTQLGVSGPTANLSTSGGAGELGSLLLHSTCRLVGEIAKRTFAFLIFENVFLRV